MSKGAVVIVGSAVLAVACGILLWMEMRMLAAFVGFGSYALASMVSKFGISKPMVLVSLASAAVFGLALCPKEGLFCMMVCTFLLMSVGYMRLLFFDQLGHARWRWLEPTLFALALGYFVFGNIYDGSGWISWSLPAPALAFAGFITLGSFLESKELTKASVKPFGVDVGKPAPDFTLPDQEGKPVTLSEYRGKRHVLLIFVRGDWCPTCHIMLRSYEKNKARFAEKNIMLLAMGPDDVSVNKVMMEKLNLDYRILSDQKLEAAKAYGMHIHGNNPMTNYGEGIPLPASFLIDIEGRVQYTSNPGNAGEILNPETIIPVVDKLFAPAQV